MNPRMALLLLLFPVFAGANLRTRTEINRREMAALSRAALAAPRTMKAREVAVCVTRPMPVLATAASKSAPAGIEPKRAVIPVGSTFQFTVTSLPLNGAPTTAHVISRNTNVATVDSITGLVTAVGPGTTFVVADLFNGRCLGKDSAKVTVTGTQGGGIIGDSARGRTAWLTNCQPCHTGDQGWDIRNIAVSDTNIIRRALPHVNDTTAADIVAHIRALGAAGPLTKNTWLYQPGSPATPVASDSMFAVTLFGADQWRTSISRDTLLNINVRNVRIPIALPKWSDEATRYDWVPGQGGINEGQLPDTLLTLGSVQTRFANWRNNPTMANAVILAEHLRVRGHESALLPDAPCTYGYPNNSSPFYRAQDCFDLAKWSASFCYTAGLRLGISGDSILSACEKTWWEAGHMAHKAQQFARTIDLRDLQITAWIYLGSLKTLAANNDASLYFCGPASHISLNRWCSFYASMQLVRRPGLTAGSSEACSDIQSTAQFGYAPWHRNLIEFQLREMMYRLDHGLQTANSKDPCITGADLLKSAMQFVGSRAGQATKDALQPLADSVRTRIAAL